MKSEIIQCLAILNQGLVGKENTIKTVFLSVLSGENIVLIGPPGTGKSMIARKIASLANQTSAPSSYFEYLLTKFSTPEELFGPLSITELKQDRFKRNTQGYLPTAEVAFLDEIFKASSSILNALLTILNEHIFHNGIERQIVPLKALIAASNELPIGQEELNALYDRFLFRVFVDYITHDDIDALCKINSQENINPLPQSKIDLIRLIEQINQKVNQVKISDETIDILKSIWIEHKNQFKEDSRESLSDRRLVKLINLMKVSAITNNRKEINLSDIFLLKDCLWNHPDNAQKVKGMILTVLQMHSYNTPNTGEVANLLFSTKTHTNERVIAEQPIIIKGFKGTGTEDDPLLISTINDLVDLAREGVGQQNFHFKQMNDIKITTQLPRILFKGNYNGNGYQIFSDDEKSNFTVLFDEIVESKFINFKITGIALARASYETKFFNCHLNYKFEQDFTLYNALVLNFINCEITHSIIECNLLISDPKYKPTGIFPDMGNSPIIYFKIKRSIIKKDLIISNNCNFTSIDCVYENNTIYPTLSCSVNYNLTNTLILSSHGFEFKGVKNNSAIENSMLINTSKKRIEFSFDGGKLETNNIFHSGSEWSGYYAGQKMSIELADKRFYENTLNWDLDTIWGWDQDKNHPYLQNIGIITPASKMAFEQPTMSKIGLLELQIKENIWL